MKESDCVDRLLRVLEQAMPGGVGFKHNDQVTAGIPDITWTWGGRTLWLEVKYEDGEVSAIQKLTLRRLGRAGMAFVIWFKGGWGTVYNADLTPGESFRTYFHLANHLRSKVEAMNA